MGVIGVDRAGLVADATATLPLRSPAWRLVFALAWPVLAQQFLVLLVLLSDQFLAGHFRQIPIEQQVDALGNQLMAVGCAGSGPVGGGVAPALLATAPVHGAWQVMSRQMAYQAAQTTANYLAWFVSSYIVLVTVGSTALVSRFVGAGDWELANHATNQSILLAVFLGVLGSVLGFAFIKPLIVLLQLRSDAALFAVDYLGPLIGFFAFQVIEQAGIACLAGAGDTRTGLWVLGGVAIINVPLAWAFFHGVGPLPAWGFSGIALGTALSHMVGAVAVLAVLASGHAGLRLSLRHLRPDVDLLRRLLRVSIPAGIDSLSVAACQLWFLGIVNHLGDVASTAHGIALRWEGLGYLSGGAIGTAAMTLVGQSLGAGQPREAARRAWVAFTLAAGIMSLMAVVFYALAPQMFLVFCPHPEQLPVIEAGVPVLRLVAFAMPGLASCIVFTAALRGAGDTRVPVLFSWIGFLVVRIPLAYWLTLPEVNLGPLGIVPGMNLGLYGAWLAMLADLTVRGVFFLVRFAGGRWQEIRV